MAEVVGLVAAAGQFVEESIKIYQLCKKVYDKFNDAPQELKVWRNEILSLQHVIDRIRDTPVLQVEDLKFTIAQCTSVSNSLLEIFKIIEFIETDKFGHKSWRVAVALSKEEEIRSLFGQLEQLKSTLDIQLGVIHLNQTNDGLAHVTSLLEGMKLSFQPGTDEDRCIQALFITDPVSDREGLVTTKGIRTPGTFEWIPKTEEFREWNAAHHGLLWISGPPGKGKTMISIFLSKLLETTKIDGTVIWFFCDDKNQSRNSAVNILRGLMSQLIQKSPRLLSYLLPTWKTQGNTLFGPESFEALWRILISMIDSLGNTEVYCVLDALDECDETSLKPLLFKLKTVSEYQSSNKIHTQLKVLITSREQPQYLPQYLSTFPRIALDDLEHDIGLYISEKVAHLARAKSIQGSPLQDHIERSFRSGAEGTFLWVSFMIKDMGPKTLHEIERSLGQLPRGLYAIYERIIAQIAPEDRVVVIDILTWILFANRPLTIPELCDAVQIKPTKALTREQVCLSYIQSCGHLLQLKRWVFNPHGKEDIIKWIVYAPSAIQSLHGSQSFTADSQEGLLSSLIVTFVHQSIKDFLLLRAGDYSSKFPVLDSSEGHTLILNRLMSLLNEHLSGEGSDKIATFEKSPLVSYAVHTWSYHFRELGDNIETILDNHESFFAQKSKLRDNWWWHSWWQSALCGVDKRKLCQDISVLHVACEQNVYFLAKAWLLPKNALLKLRRKREINSRWALTSETPLHAAVSKQSYRIVELLLNCGADVDVENGYMKTPLHVAIYSSFEASQKIFHLLSTSRAGIQAIKNESKYESTRALRPELLIHMAAAQGSVDICKNLVMKYKYNIDWKTYDGLAPLRIALMGRHLDLAKIMVTRWGATLPSEIDSFRAVIHGIPAQGDSLVEGFKLLTEAWGFDINAPDHLGNTIFHDPNYDLIPVLRGIEVCDLKIDWNKKNSLGQTFLHCNFNWLTDPVLLSTFLQHSQSGVNTCDLQGRSPISMYFITNLGLIISEKRGAVDVRTPLDFGADRYLADNEGRTALGVASSYLESIREQNHPAESLIHIEESIELWTNYSTVAIDVGQVDLRLNQKSNVGSKAEL